MKHNTINVQDLQSAQTIAAINVAAGATNSYTRSRAEAPGHNFIYIWDTDMTLVLGQCKSKGIKVTTSYLEM